jgi:ATP-dependent Zn protease
MSKSRRLRSSKAQLRATAYHEAGHIVITLVLGRKVKSASIIATAEHHGIVHHENLFRGIRLDIDNSNRARLRAAEAIMILLAGGIAQQRFMLRSLRAHHVGSDNAKIFDSASNVCGSEDEAYAFIEWLSVRTCDLLNLHWSTVERIAAALIERKQLTGKECHTLFLAPPPGR